MKTIVILSLIILIYNPIKATDYYWVGGTGNWSDYANHWATSSGGSTFHPHVPLSTDNVFFDINSFNNTGQSLTIDLTIAYCLDMSWIGVANNPSLVNYNELKIYGSLTLDSNMSLTGTINGDIFFVSNQSGNTIDTDGVMVPQSITFDNVNGEWTLLDSIYKNDGGIAINNGILNTNDHNMTVRYVAIYNNSTINLGSSIISIFSGGTWNMYSSANINAGTSNIVYTNDFGSSAFYGGGKTYYNLIGLENNLNFMIFGNNNYNKIEFNGDGCLYDNNNIDSLICSPGHTYTILSGGIQTINNFIDINGLPGYPIEFISNISGTQGTISKSSGYICAQYLYLSDINASGGALFYAGLGSDDVINNTGWIFNVSTSCSEIVKTDDINYLNNISIFPNPTTGVISITNEGLEITDLEVFDIYGKEVYINRSLSLSKCEIDLSQNPKGIYIIKVKTSKGVAVEKVIKN